MRIRKSGLGGYFAITDHGVNLRLEKCVDCGRYIAYRLPWLIRDCRINLLCDLHDNDISTGNYSSRGDGKLICRECTEKEFREREISISDLPTGTPIG